MRIAATLDSCEILTEGWHGGHDNADVLFDAGGSISLTTRRGRDEDIPPSPNLVRNDFPYGAVTSFHQQIVAGSRLCLQVGSWLRNLYKTVLAIAAPAVLPRIRVTNSLEEDPKPYIRPSPSSKNTASLSCQLI